ncbi:MAG: hypothetical protein J7623_12800 [Chitinophaga sp.]|uniref:hypothetical protein n=1 Tax=Chitinophaga sp. TaxID=1869181 RepID=UPI001B0768B0|nr:hypothetical protein [Chitinophaga sp.]MBO9729508.1 hypothetical protein [Chitinophaga sp.]
MNKILSVVILFAFVIFWASNIFFNLPDNPIKIKFSKEEAAFQSVLFQRWSFFAPPPKNNERLYYFFRSKSDTTQQVVFEVLGPITARKQQTAPFNMLEEKEDYIISGSISEVNDFLFQYTNELKFRHKDKPEAELVQMATQQAWAVRAKLSGIATLTKYGTLIAAQHHISTDYEMKFMIAQLPIPKFVDRNKVTERNSPGVKTFETPFIAIPKG